MGISFHSTNPIAKHFYKIIIIFFITNNHDTLFTKRFYVKKTLLNLSILILLFSCGESQNLETISPNKDKANLFINALNDELLSSDFSYIDDYTEKGGAWILIIENNSGRIYPVDLDSWNENSDIQSWLASNVVTNSNMERRNRNIRYSNSAEDFINQNYIFEEINHNGKNLEAIAAKIKIKTIQKLTHKLSFEYEIPLERAQHIAELSISLMNIKTRRRLRDEEINIYTKELTGFTYSEAKKALEDSFNGNDLKINNILDSAARINDTSPEAVLEIFNFIYR